MSGWRSHLVWVPLLLILAAAVCAYSVMTGSHYVDSAHNGFFVKNAIDLLEGRAMFRESFSSYGLLSTFIHAVSMKIWGWQITSLLNVTLVFVVGISVAIYLLWAAVMPAWAAFLASALYLLYSYRIHLPWPNYYATFFILCCGLVLMAWLRDRRRRQLVVAGVLAGTVFLARQNLAPPLILLLTVFLVAVPGRNRQERLRRLVPFLGGAAAAVTPLFLYLLFQSAVSDWWVQSVSLIPLWYTPFAQVGDDLPSRLRYLGASLVGHLPWVTATALAGSALVTVRLMAGRLAAGREGTALIAALSLALLSQVYPNEGLWRHVLGLSLGFGWPLYLVSRLAGAGWLSGLSARLPRVAIAAVVFAVAGYLVWPKVTAIREEVRAALELEANREIYFQRMTAPEIFEGMWLPKEQARFYGEIYQEIEKYRAAYPDAPVITTTGDVLPLLFVRNNTGFSPMFTVYPSIHWARLTRGAEARENPAQAEATLAALRANHGFDGDTANALGYPAYWDQFAAFIKARKPLIIGSGQAVAGYAPVKTVVFEGTRRVVDSQYYFWWSQFADRPQSVVLRPTD